MKENDAGAPAKEVLRRIADEGGYQYNGSWSEDRAWLLWPTRDSFWPFPPASTDESTLDRLFPLPEDFHSTVYQQAPNIDFLRLHREGDIDFKKHRKEQREFAQRYQTKKGLIQEEALPSLNARREALKTQIKYNGERLRTGPLQEIRRLLMVWFMEASKTYEANSGEGGDLKDALWLLGHHARGLWHEISHGRKTKELKGEDGWLDALLKHGSKILAQTQHERILELLEERDYVIKNTLPIRRELRYCEHTIRSALGYKPVYTEEVVREWKGKPLRYVLTVREELLEYAKAIRKEKDWTLKETYYHIVEAAESIPVGVMYPSFESFRQMYYDFH